MFYIHGSKWETKITSTKKKTKVKAYPITVINYACVSDHQIQTQAPSSGAQQKYMIIRLIVETFNLKINVAGVPSPVFNLSTKKRNEKCICLKT